MHQVSSLLSLAKVTVLLEVFNKFATQTSLYSLSRIMVYNAIMPNTMNLTIG